MSRAHDPTAPNAEGCGACRAGAHGYDHDAVRARRPKDFEEQVLANVEVIARGAPTFAGIALHPDAPRRARQWLRAHQLEKGNDNER